MRIRHYKEYLDDVALVLKANDGVVCLREAPLGPYKDAIALRPDGDHDVAGFYNRLLEQSSVEAVIDESTSPDEADQIRDLEANLLDILQEQRSDWRLDGVHICRSCMYLEYRNTAQAHSKIHFVTVEYGGWLYVRFKMAPTMLGHPVTYELKVNGLAPKEDGKPRWSVRLTEDLQYVRRDIRFDEKDDEEYISLDVTEYCGY